MTSTLLYTILSLSILGGLLAVILYFVAQKFKVQEDLRIDQVLEALPGANCGGCGFAGCRAFGLKKDEVASGKFFLITPNTKNPYRALYTFN